MPDTMTAKRYRSDRWHRLDAALKGGLDQYVAERRAAQQSWHTIASAIARDTAKHPDIAPPTVTTLMRWYEQHQAAPAA